MYPWRLAILAILAKMANLCQRAGDSVWRAKVDPWRVAIFAKLATSAKMAKFGKNGEFGTIGDIQNVADILVDAKWPLEIKLLKRFL